MIKKYLLIAGVCIITPLCTIDSAKASASTTKTAITTDSKSLSRTVSSKSSYQNLGVSIAESYLNIRNKPSTQGKIVGKLYTGTVATMLSTSGDWVKVKSGDVQGYVSKKYLATGAAAEKLFIKYANPVATVKATSLRVRKSNSTSSKTLGLVSKGAKLQVISQGKKWTKIRYNGGKAYVSNDYVDLSYTFEYAVSIEEERENLKQEQASGDEVKKPNTTSNQSNSQSNTSNSTSIGVKVATYAKKFIGNPYVWGGTSLTNGADCSGFIQSVYKKFGYSVPRTSREQAKAGTSVSQSNIKSGDIVSYAKNGTVNHVALYVGDGLVVHASNPKDGIKLSKYNYRSIHSIRRIVK